MKPGLVILAVVVFIAVLVFALRRKAQLEVRGLAEMQAVYGDSIAFSDPRAVYYGVESKGFLQTHEIGGTFVITPDVVRFKSWAYGSFMGHSNDADVVIAMNQITGFGNTKDFATLFLKRVRGDGLFAVKFTDADGKPNTLALSLYGSTDEAFTVLEKHTGQLRVHTGQ